MTLEMARAVHAAIDAIDAIAAATPEPPAPDVDAAEVLELALVMMKDREPHVASLRRAVGTTADSLRDDRHVLALVSGLREREARWAAALTRARQTVGRRIGAAGKMRRGYGT